MKLSTLISQFIIFFLVGILAACSSEPEKDITQNQVFDIAVLVMSDMYLPLSVEGLKEGMAELGYQEGKNIRYQIYNAKGDIQKLKQMAVEIVASHPDVICPSIVTAIEAIRETSTNLPVVFLESMYPVEFGVVKSLTTPGTNYTGVSNMTGPMSGKRLELLQQMVSGIKNVGLIVNPENRVANLSMEETQKAAEKLGLQLTIQQVHQPAEVDIAINKLENSSIDALVLNPDFMVFSRLDKIIEMALRKNIPTIGIDSAQVEKGILASYGGGLKDIAKQAARQVDQVLQDKSPANIAIEAPSHYQLFVNLTTADKLGIELPKAILHQAAGYYR